MAERIAIDRLQVGRSRDRAAIGEGRPPLTWSLKAESSPQTAYEIRIVREGGGVWRTGVVESTESVSIEWPTADLVSRERADVDVRARAAGGTWSEWSATVRVEASLLGRLDWGVDFVSPSPSEAAPASGARGAYLLRAEFTVPEGPLERVRLYSTAHGVYELEVNGARPTEEILAPGWSSYEHRLRFQTTFLEGVVKPGTNVLGVWLADGWYRGRLGFNGGVWNNYGADASFLAQLEITRSDQTVEVLPLDWRWQEAPITASGLYDGEAMDARLGDPDWSTISFDASGWGRPAVLPLERFHAALEPTISGPVEVVDRLEPVEIERRPNGRIRFDFGQNIAGRIRVSARAEAGTAIALHHAEVLEEDELAVRPLRSAPSIDRYTFRDAETIDWAPRFTYHGFRFAELEGWTGSLDDVAVTAEVLHTVMERTGWFDSSHDLLNRLHENTVWGMRGNFVDLPTDCPQRDERLGWTGDIQVFAPAAAFLYDSSALLRTWLRDVAAEQDARGAVPNFVPWIECGFPTSPSAAWGDAAVIVPWVVYERTGDSGVLRDQYPSMTSWVDLVDELSGSSGLWTGQFQLGDWLDPAAPPEHPGDSRTDRDLVATAYFARSAELLAKAAEVLERHVDAAHYRTVHLRARAAFQREYTTESGRLVSDTASALSLALVFGLLDGQDRRATAGRRLIELVKHSNHRIETGFVGTPIICDALVLAGGADTAYHLLLQEQFPSWLFPVTMGATTIWERWDSMLPDGRINPGEMTSFNHYALGAIVDFLHRRVAGLAPETAGYRTIRVAPQPGGGLSRASARHRTPYGEAEVSWHRTGGTLFVDVTVPPGAVAIVSLPVDDWDELEVGPGRHRFETAYRPVEDDPAAPVRVDPHSHAEPEAAAI